ncbi:MAG TPA: hypothetical protein VJ385_16385 [Fibrobacteria bacterium]|nr:hypothetical protein [Fibrobacteria bacterium]
MRWCHFRIRILLAIAALTATVGTAAAETGAEPASPGEAAGYAFASASAAPEHAAYFAPTLRFDADAGSLEVTFGIEEGARVSLHAFDAQGKLLAVMLDAKRDAGFHHLSLFSNRLQGYQGRVVFQLRAGRSVLAETRMRSL